MQDLRKPEGYEAILSSLPYSGSRIRHPTPPNPLCRTELHPCGVDLADGRGGRTVSPGPAGFYNHTPPASAGEVITLDGGRGLTQRMKTLHPLDVPVKKLLVRSRHQERHGYFHFKSYGIPASRAIGNSLCLQVYTPFDFTLIGVGWVNHGCWTDEFDGRFVFRAGRLEVWLLTLESMARREDSYEVSSKNNDAYCDVLTTRTIHPKAVSQFLRFGPVAARRQVRMD